MKKITTRNIVYGVIFAMLLTAIITLSLLPVRYVEDPLTNALIRGSLIRVLGGAFALFSCFVFGADVLNPLHTRGARSFLWCLPCILVVLVNFPVSALATGSAAIDRTELLWLFALSCVLIGVFEEFLFRGFFQSIFEKLFQKKKYADFLTVLVTSALFALWHLFNLLDGASVGETLLQVGYSFLIGAMLSCVVLRTGSVWFCVLLHAVFDFGGMLIPTLGHGVFQDACFWILTAAAGALCCAHVIAYLVKKRR